MKKYLLLFVFLLTFLNINGFSQAASSAINLKASRIMYLNILKTIKDDLKSKYYDSKLGGVDVEDNAKKATELINEAKSVEEMSDIVARFLYPFNDSHLFFIPPSKTTTVDYGWEMKFVGDKAYVVEIDEQSDAYKKGVRTGDQIYMVNDYILTRPEFFQFKYHFYTLRPQRTLNVLLIKPSGNKYKLDLSSKVKVDNVFLPSSRDLLLEAETEYEESTKQQFSDQIPGLAVWKMPNFGLSPTKLEKMVDKVMKSNALILDLRGNPGGYLSAMMRLASHFTKGEVKVGVLKERDGAKTLVTKPIGKEYQGKLVVLVDSESASGAELFARFVQLEKRGQVLGDQSSGAVMASRIIYNYFGLDTRIPYGLSLTIADILMKDGQRLEKIGVTPDEKILPTAADLAARRDPVMARAAELLGFKMTAEQAGAIFDDKK